MSRKVKISAVATALILLLGMFGFHKLSNQKKSTISDAPSKVSIRSVKVSNLISTDLPNEINIDGRLVPYEKVDLFSKVSAQIEQSSKPFKEGTYYTKGELIFRLDDQEAKFTLLSQRSVLLNSITQIMPDLKFDYPQAFEKWQNYLLSFDLEKTTAPLPLVSNNQEKFFVASKSIYNQYYNIKSLETRMKEYYIKAPISGVLTEANAYTGMLIGPSTKLGTIINSNEFELEAPISLSDLNYISIGQHVKLATNSSTQSWDGIVKRIGNKIDDKTQYVPIYIHVKGKELKEGLYLSGIVHGKKLANVVAIDKEYMPSQNTVYVVKDSVLTTQAIDIYKNSSKTVYTRSIKPDQMVVTDVISGLYEGQKVKATLVK